MKPDGKVCTRAKPFILSKYEFLQARIRVGGMQFKRAISHRINIEDEKVNAFPTHGYLDNAMQFAQRNR